MEGAGYSQSVQEMARTFADEDAVGARDLIQHLVSTHSNYARGQVGSFDIPWPREAGTSAPVEEYLGWIDALYEQDTWPNGLHGRAVIIGASLLDRAVGRALVACGLFQAIAAELDPRPRDVLTADGLDRLATIPLAVVDPDAPAASFAPAQQVAMSRDGTVIAVADEQEVRVHRRHQVDALVAIRIVGAHTVAVTADGSEIRVASETGWHRFDAAGEPLSGSPIPLGDRAPAWVLAAAVGGGLVAPDGGGGLMVMDPDGRVRTLEFTDGFLTALSPGGRVLATLDSAGTTEILDLHSGSRVPGPAPIEVTPAAMAVDDRGRVAYARAKPGEPPDRSSAVFYVDPSVVDDEDITHMAFSPDGRFLAVGGAAATTRILSVDDGRELAILGSGGSSIRFSGDGHWLTQTGRSATSVWEVGLTHAPIPSPPISFSADIADARSDDLLDIDAAVDAFASLIAARDLEPPLSIGVFGEWGSGKTFFMRRLRRRVGERSSAALDSRVPQREIAFAKRIVQIEFNAWHYSGGNLWAGMVQHIFDNLRLFGEKDPSAVARRQQEILRQMDDLVEIEGQLSEDLRQQEKEHARSLELMRQLDEQHSAEIEKLAELSSLTSDEIKEVLRSDSELDEQVDELQRRVKATGAPESAESLMREAQRSVDLLRRSGPAISSLRERSWSTILALAAALGLSVVLGILVDLTTDLSGVLSTIGAMLTVAVIWLRKANDWYEQRLTRFERIEAILGRKLEDKRRQHEAERRRVAASIAALEGRMDEIGKEMDRVERQRVLLDDQLRRTTPTRVLADFILERAQADDYRQYLGLRARIRDDFEQIAGILDEQRRSIGEASTIEAEEAQGKDRVDRIVLYIDDLDRCEPDVVVDVLQAVHLLLAFPIFVVVVGVDARWISRALHKRYPDLLRHQDTPPVDRATSIPPAPPSEPASPPPLGPGPHDDQDTEDVRATSLDYLEKIFQIPYWLAPMDAVGAERFISGMIGATAPVAGTTVPGRTGAPLASVAAEEAAEPEPTPSAEPAAAPARDPDLSPRALTVDEAERLYMLAVAGLMDSTPRAVKRFLNLYRLVKVMASDPLDFVAVRERYGAPYQVVMVMLAIDAGMPDDTEPMLTAMTETPASTLKEFTSEPRPPEVSELAWERLGEWVSVPGEEDRGGLAVSLFRQWIPTVRQFSFRVHA